MLTQQRKSLTPLPPTTWGKISWGIRLALLAALLCTAFLNLTYFTSLENSSKLGEIENFSNSITAEHPLTIEFKVSGKRLEKITLPLVPNSDESFDQPLSIALYDSAGNLVLEQNPTADQLAAQAANYTILPEKALKNGHTYKLVLTSTQTDEELCFRVPITSAGRSDILGWYCGSTAEDASLLPFLGLFYNRVGLIYSVLFAGCLAMGLLSLFAPDLRSRRLRLTYQHLVLFAAPLPILYTAELLQYNAVQAVGKALIGNYFVLLFVLLVFYAITGRAWQAVRWGGGLLLLAAVANFYTLTFRGTIIMPSDIYSISTAAEVIPGYHLFLHPSVFMALAVFFALFCASGWSRDRFQKRTVRVALLVCPVALGAALWNFLSTPAMYHKIGAELNTFRQTSQAKNNGFFLNFALNIPDLFLAEPDGYSAKAVDSYAAADAADVTLRPNILMVMNESFADLSLAGDTRTSEDPLQFVHALAADDDASTYVGWLTVPVYGGGTSCTEFEALTGFSLAFCNSASAPYAQYIHTSTPSLPSSLAQLGYETLAFHPESGANWNRNSAYPLLGFDQQFFYDDLFDNAPTMRTMVSDHADYALTLEELATVADPWFAFNITMQNHGGYDSPLLASSISITDAPGEYPLAEQYFTLMQESDRQLEDLIGQLSESDEPTILVFFGDHWGSVEDSYVETLFGRSLNELTDEENLMRYTTPIVIWTNCEDLDLSCLPEYFSANFLSPLLKQVAGLPCTGFENQLLAVMQDYPVISVHGIVDSDGVLSAGMPAEAAASLADYACSQYNGLHDTKHRSQTLFGYAP